MTNLHPVIRKLPRQISVKSIQMLFDTTSPDQSTRESISDLVGKSLTRTEQFDSSGIESQTFQIAEASAGLQELLIHKQGDNQCNIEFREHGVLVHFLSGARSMVWVLPFWQINIYFNAGTLTLFGKQNFVKLVSPDGRGVDKPFVQKMYELLARSTGQDHDIYGSLP